MNLVQSVAVFIPGVCGTKFLYDHATYNLHEWCLAQSPSCDCGQRQTMNHIIDCAS